MQTEAIGVVSSDNVPFFYAKSSMSSFICSPYEEEQVLTPVVGILTHKHLSVFERHALAIQIE